MIQPENGVKTIFLEDKDLLEIQTHTIKDLSQMKNTHFACHEEIAAAELVVYHGVFGTKIIKSKHITPREAPEVNDAHIKDLLCARYRKILSDDYEYQMGDDDYQPKTRQDGEILDAVKLVIRNLK